MEKKKKEREREGNKKIIEKCIYIPPLFATDLIKWFSLCLRKKINSFFCILSTGGSFLSTEGSFWYSKSELWSGDVFFFINLYDIIPFSDKKFLPSEFSCEFCHCTKMDKRGYVKANLPQLMLSTKTSLKSCDILHFYQNIFNEIPLLTIL